MTTTAVLPEKLSDLLELALADLEKAEADPMCHINMDNWLENFDTGRCSACLAGCVMRYSLGETRKFVTPSMTDFPAALNALDDIRNGQIEAALFRMGMRTPRGVPSEISMVNYNRNPERFKIGVRYIVAMLKEHGL